MPRSDLFATPTVFVVSYNTHTLFIYTPFLMYISFNRGRRRVGGERTVIFLQVERMAKAAAGILREKSGLHRAGV